MTTHALLIPAPIHDPKTVCGGRPSDFPKEDLVSSLDEMIDCVPCKAMLGKLPLEDWNKGLPEVTDFDVSGNKITMTVAHQMAQVMAASFLDLLDQTEAENYVELCFGRNEAPEKQITVTIQRVNGKRPSELRAIAERERDEARAELAELKEYIDELSALYRHTEPEGYE